MRLRIAIVDDEELARAVVREYLTGMPDIEVVAECANGFEAVKAVSELKPGNKVKGTTIAELGQVLLERGARRLMFQ